MSKPKVKLPRSYWKELDRLDRAVFDVAQIGEPEKFGPRKVDVFNALWQSESALTNEVFWAGKRFSGSDLRAQTIMSVVEYAPTDEFHTAVTADIYQYCTFPFMRELTMRRELITDVATFLDADKSHERPSNLHQHIGAIIMTREHCDRLIAELERGASGEYALPI